MFRDNGDRGAGFLQALGEGELAGKPAVLAQGPGLLADDQEIGGRANRANERASLSANQIGRLRPAYRRQRPGNRHLLPQQSIGVHHGFSPSPASIEWPHFVYAIVSGIGRSRV